MYFKYVIFKYKINMKLLQKKNEIHDSYMFKKEEYSTKNENY